MQDKIKVINDRGMVLLGCGRMGSAMLRGWLDRGVLPQALTVLDPHPSDWLQELASQGLHLNADLPENPAICVLAVKPQMMGEALPALQALGNRDVLFVSVAAGTSINTLKSCLGAGSPIIRAMPNTPAAIAKGITALTACAETSNTQKDLAEALLSSVGQTLWVEAEPDMDAVTAVSGSGPAYIFHFIEALTEAGRAAGLSAEVSAKLALATVVGAADLAECGEESPTELRENVTSPGGTTQAALEVLMDNKRGLTAILREAVLAAKARSEELNN